MLVSVVIPARDWDVFLEQTVASILRCELPSGIEIEVIVALGGRGPAETPDGVRVVPNPSGTIPDGLNLAIAASTGEIVVRVDSRCLVPPDHITRVLDDLADPGLGCVGGAQLVLDRGAFGSAYAVAFNSVLMGPTVYRYRRTPGPVDTAYLGAWRREDLESLGGFDPRMMRNQDNELADRVRASGKVVYYDADLVVGYYNARDFRGAMAHHHEFGLWRMVQREQGQRAFTPRHVVAVGVAGLGAALGVGLVASRSTRRHAALGAVAAYFGAGAYARHSAGRLRRARPDIDGPPFHPLAPVIAPVVAAALDGAWLAGVVRGALRQRR